MIVGGQSSVDSPLSTPVSFCGSIPVAGKLHSKFFAEVPAGLRILPLAGAMLVCEEAPSVKLLAVFPEFLPGTVECPFSGGMGDGVFEGDAGTEIPERLDLPFSCVILPSRARPQSFTFEGGTNAPQRGLISTGFDLFDAREHGPNELLIPRLGDVCLRDGGFDVHPIAPERLGPAGPGELLSQLARGTSDKEPGCVLEGAWRDVEYGVHAEIRKIVEADPLAGVQIKPEALTRVRIGNVGPLPHRAVGGGW